MKKIAVLIFVFALSMTFHQDAWAQKKKSKKNGDKAQVIDDDQTRVQFDIGKNPQSIEIVRLDTGGLLLVYTLPSDQNVYINKYDKDLNKVYSTTLKVSEDSYISAIKEYKQNLYFLVIDDANTSSSLGYSMQYKVIEFNHTSKKVSEVGGTFEKKRLVQDLIPCDGGAYISTLHCLTPGQMGTRILLNCCALGIPSLFGYTKYPYVPYLVSINFTTKKTDEQILEYPNQSAILGGDLDDEKQELNLSIKNKVKKKENKIYVSNFKLATNGKASKVKETEIDLPAGKDFYSAKINTLNAEERLIFGTYGPETKYLNEAGSFANGLYLSKVVNGKCVFTTVVRYDEMESFMTAKQKKKQNDAPAKSKKERSYSRGLIFHDIIEDDKQFILTAESYYPTYRTESYYNASTKRWETRQVFDGYQYGKLLVFGFSKDGKKLWEQNMDLPYYKTYSSPKILLVKNEVVEGDLYFTVAHSNGNIKFVKLNNDNTISGLSSSEEIENIEGETVLSRSFINGGILYDNHYIVYGWERIIKDKNGKKNTSESDAKTVIFINKIAVYPE